MSGFLWQLGTILFVIFAIPALTMRLLSEEKRTGTLEVTMTTPVEEVQVVLSKFFAAWIMYLLMWVPLGIYLIAFRLGTAANFDYWPLLSFSVALLLTGAMFVSMGVFFSSLTRNQVISGVLTFTGMLCLTLIIILKDILERPMGGMGRMAVPQSNDWLVAILKHISYLDFWSDTMQGRMMLRQMLFPVTATILWLFLSVKVLEARKWL